MRRFLTRMGQVPPRNLKTISAQVEDSVWERTDCLSCANCCKTMTPTFNQRDQRRIAAHLGLSVEDFRKKWLRKERGAAGDWINRSEPCQFLDLQDNKCSIYAVRPDDCAGFPHLGKKMRDYVHVHKQNVTFCPATFRFVEGLMERAETSGLR